MHINTISLQKQLPLKKLQKNFNYKDNFHFEDIPIFIKKDPEKFFQSLPHASQKCLDLLFWHTFKCHAIFMSQNTLADLMGNSLTHCNRVLKNLRELGLIATLRRPYKTNLYQIADYLLHPAMIKRLSFIFPSLRALAIGHVLMNEKEGKNAQKGKNVIQGEYVILTNLRYKNIYKNYTTKNKRKDFSKKNIKELLREMVIRERVGKWVNEEDVNFSGIVLNERAKIKMSVFSPVVLRKVKELLRKKTLWKIKNIFGWLYGKALKYSEELRLLPQWEIGKRLERVGGESAEGWLERDITWWGSSGVKWEKKLPQYRKYEVCKYEVSEPLEMRRSRFAEIAKMLSCKKHTHA